MDNTVFRICNLEKTFGGNEVLRDISFDVKAGEVVSIIGASGTGKSTLLRCINRLETPTSGSIYFHGEDIAAKGFDLSHYRAKVGMVFQQFNLFNNLTVLENCVVGQMKVLGRSREEAEANAKRHLASVGMLQYRMAKPAQISGGQKQRVAIAGILAMQPSVIIADEATAMLDPSGRKEVLKTIKRLNREKGITVVWITHFMEEAAQADRIIVMNKGTTVLSGTPREVFEQVDTLRDIHLDVPHMTDLSQDLRKAGMPLPAGILTVEEMAEEVCKCLSK